MKAKITRASVGNSEGRSLWFDKRGFQKHTRSVFNSEFQTNFLPKQSFNMIVKIGNAKYKILGHFNKSRGDFYISLEEWDQFVGLKFDVGNQIRCEVLGYEI